MIKNANTLLFRASSMGNIMTNDTSGKKMGETAKKNLLKIYAQENNSRYEEINSKFLEKGNTREEDAITLLSRITKKIYRKNIVRLKNDWFSGEPDLFEGKEILKATATNDTKCSWSYITFLEAAFSKTNPIYFYQGQVYMDLCGAKVHTVSYCLVNGTFTHIMDEKRKAAYAMGILDMTAAKSPAYLKKCQQIERNHIFDIKAFEGEYPHFDLDNSLAEWETNDWDIPIEKRLCQKTFEYDPKMIDSMKLRVLEGRNWLNNEFFGIK